MSGLTTIERLLLPLVRRFVALWVRPSVLPDGLAERLGSGRTVVYALEKRSVIDVAVLEHVCRERSLPLPLAPPDPVQCCRPPCSSWNAGRDSSACDSTGGCPRPCARSRASRRPIRPSTPTSCRSACSGAAPRTVNVRG